MGGRSRRLGQDKRLVQVGGQNLWARTSGVVESLLGRKPILVGDNLPEECHIGYRILRDALPDRGPLGGLVAALRACPSPWALILAVDLPFLQPSDLELLLHADVQPCQALTLSLQGQPEPLATLYQQSTMAYWERRLVGHQLSMHAGLGLLKWRAVLLPPRSRALENLNRPEDLDKLTSE